MTKILDSGYQLVGADLLRFADRHPEGVKPHVRQAWQQFLPHADVNIRPIQSADAEILPGTATRGSLETLTIVQDHESLTLLSQLFIRRVTIFCLPGSAVATATVENKEGIYFCKQNINWKRRGLATVVGAFSRLAIRKLQDNPRVAKYLDFATWPKTLDDVHDDIFFAYVTGQREFLHRASAVYGQPAVDGVCIALRDFFAELRDATSLIA